VIPCHVRRRLATHLRHPLQVLKKFEVRADKLDARCLQGAAGGPTLCKDGGFFNELKKRVCRGT
jgi:hypothetical protein